MLTPSNECFAGPDLITPAVSCGQFLACCSLQFECDHLGLPATPTPVAAGVCGEEYSTDPGCPAECPSVTYTTLGSPKVCCGIDIGNFAGDRCVAPERIPTQTPQPLPTSVVPPGNSQVVNSEFLWDVNPLNVLGNSDPTFERLFKKIVLGKFGTPADFLNTLMPFLFGLAGMILFIMIVWGGFEMMMGAADTKSQEAGKQRVTAALIGFTLLFISYWIAQILQYIFGVNIIG